MTMIFSQFWDDMLKISFVGFSWCAPIGKIWLLLNTSNDIQFYILLKSIKKFFPQNTLFLLKNDIFISDELIDFSLKSDLLHKCIYKCFSVYSTHEAFYFDPLLL